MTLDSFQWVSASHLPEWPLGPLLFLGAAARASSAPPLAGSPLENFLFFFGILLLPASLANGGGPVLGGGLLVSGSWKWFSPSGPSVARGRTCCTD